MHKHTAINFTKISNEQTNELTTVVKETIAKSFVSFKTFTTADLWNIQRRDKTSIKRRHLI